MSCPRLMSQLLKRLVRMDRENLPLDVNRMQLS